MSKKRISVPKPGGAERGAMRDVLQLLRSGRTGLEQGAYQQNLLAPYMYNLAGLDVQYDDRSGQLQAAQAERDQAMSLQSQLRTARGKAEKRSAREAIGQQYTNAADLKSRKLKKYLKGKIRGAESEIGDISNAPLRIRSITEKPEIAAQRAREAQLLKTQQEFLQKSLSMTPEDVLAADPALRRQLQEEQAKLEQAQVQQFGGISGAQGGTVGAVQNAAMAQRRAEAISNARRENIGLYAGLQTQQAQANLQSSGARQGLGMAPSGAQQASGMSFGQLGAGYNPLLQQYAGNRQMQYQANAFNQTQPSIGESVLKGIGSLLQPFKSSE